MRYTVALSPLAEAGLAAAYVAAVDRNGLTALWDRIEARLRRDPVAAGTSQEGLFSIRVPPLSVMYEVRPDDRVVQVQSVRLLRTAARGEQHGSNGRSAD